MEKKFGLKRVRNKLLGALMVCLLMEPLSVQAASTAAEMAVYPNVSVSPDGSGQVWTTDYGDKTDEMLPSGYTIDMRAESSLRELYPGEHYYEAKAEGSVTIGKWVVKHTPGQCIHDTPTRDSFAGFTFSNAICYTHYNNGWFAYCADCGKEVAFMLLYGKSSTMKKITAMPASSIYVYLCPYCNHLEQGHNYQHVCKGISQNRYRVTYRPNAPSDSVVGGYMAPTRHMYNNADSYNGEAASLTGYTDTALRKNSFSCEGYVFAGWNTKADGSGTFYEDGADILNLTSEDAGVVKLYAQWKKCESTLILDAAGGTYKGQAVYEQTQAYGTSYNIDVGLVTPPAGYQVSFHTNGGSAVATITTSKSFSHWEQQEGFAGTFKGNVYTYKGPDGARDMLTASYTDDSFILPNSTKSNASLAGWYDNPGLTEDGFLGKPGDKVTVDRDTVLYAKWATLTLWAYDDYASHGGVGAVDLTWEQKDGRSKYYRLYQSTDKVTWKEIHTGSDIGSSISISESYGTGNQGSTYTIPHTGNYILSATGASGADYNASLTGGKGGRVTATYWLRQGDVLTFYAGTAGSGTGGGTNGAAANGGTSKSYEGRGGGAGTEIYVTRNGSRTLLLVAGGGSGANKYYAGSHGGESLTDVSSQAGHSAAYGGGGGGCYGEAVRHYCSDGCYEIIEETNGWRTDCYWVGDDYYEEWACSMCGAGTGDYHYHSTVPGGDYSQTIVHVSGGSPPWGTVCCTEEIENKICGYENGQILSYQLSCTYKDLPSGAVIYAKAPKGGSNYINMNFGCKNQSTAAGVHSGNGSASVQSMDIGYKEQNALADVLAKDMAAPGLITAYDTSMSGETLYRVKVTEPVDYGTVYYHKAESYEEGSITKIATSNITANTLVSGIKGYRYFVDTNESGTVTGSHGWTESNTVDVVLKEHVQYLHMAAVDVAGNIGPTLHISIPKAEDTGEEELDDDYFKAVPLKTEMLILNDTEYVYESAPGTYFVKADGETEHALIISGYVAGKATNNYQPDWLRLVSTAEVTEWYQAKMPRLNVNAGDRVFGNEELMTDASIEDFCLLTPMSALAERTRQAAKVKMEQLFTIDATNDGKQIYVYPRVMAEYEAKEYWSEEGLDKSHGLTLIPDAVAPVIDGIEELENVGNIDMTVESKSFTITAADSGSGVRNLTINITNQDNFMTRTYTSDTGSLTITVAKDDYLFLGDFVVSAEAVDNVGNHTNEGSDKLAFTLDAELQRAREPYGEDFKAGDGAVLTVTTGGYADKVSIRFPDELLALNPDLNKEYVYEFPEAIKTEVYEFNLPLATPSGIYIIEVEAWKDDRMLMEELQLPVRTNGSITDEFRTRIRDNGV